MHGPYTVFTLINTKMKKLSLGLAMAAIATGAQAYWMPTPEITSEVSENGKTTIEWTYDDSELCTYFHVIVYKMHKAQEDGRFVLASSDFSHIESEGTINNHQERGALWDYLPDNPGWWVRSPLYMGNAMGIDTFNYFAGSDNSDIFGGAYMVSPDYDLTNLSDKTVNVSASLAAEAVSVSGGFCIWAWNTNWSDPTNIDYKPITTLDHHYTLSTTNFKTVEEACAFPDVADYTDPDEIDEINGICPERTRVMFYGRGYSSYWINNFEVSVNMKKGETVDYGAAIYQTEENSFVIDTSGDTDTDYTYAYEVRAVREDYDDYRDLTTVRATNYAYNAPKRVIGQTTGIGSTDLDGSNIDIRVAAGRISISNAEGLDTRVYSTDGACVFEGASDSEITLPAGIYIVKTGTNSAKVVI